MWGQFFPRPSVALVVIFSLESPTLEGKHSSFYLIRHEPMFGGKLNPSLLDLKHLNYSDLSFNNFFASPILEFLGSIKSLTSLNLSNVGFVGVIPHQLGNLSNLLYSISKVLFFLVYM